LTAANPHSRPRLYSLDALRGLAALGVVLWHWQHFFSKGMGLPYRIESLPFFGALFPFYRFGWLAVFLFFSLSGFVFFWLYARGLRERTIPARTFFVFRFARLYPLHAVTLLAVLAGQTLFRHRNGFDFVYVHNDLRHFILNLFMASSWGLEKGWSFNGPFWSVSVEVFLYAVFFLFCRATSGRRFAKNGLLLLVTGLAGYFVLTPHVEMLGKGWGAFFLGGVAYTPWARLTSMGNGSGPTEFSRRAAGMTRARCAALGITALTTLLWGIAFWLRLRFPHFVWPPLGFLSGTSGWRLSEQFVGSVTLVLSPLTVLSVASLESAFGGVADAARRLSWLGDLSYASYLLHFPLQLAFALITTSLSISNGFYRSPGSLLLFFSILIPLSLAVHHGFEMPAQRWLRKRLNFIP